MDTGKGKAKIPGNKLRAGKTRTKEPTVLNL
jgi:hypothetical protein